MHLTRIFITLSPWEDVIEPNVGAYLAHAKEQSEQEQVLRTAANAWLPDVIIDAHTHCGLWEHVGEIPEHLQRHMMTTFPWFTLEESTKWNEFLYPNRVVRKLRFAHAFRGIRHAEANDYLLEKTGLMDRVALYGLPDDIEYTVRKLQDPRVSALKMYHQYFEKPATRIYEFFPREVLEEAQDAGVPIILHLPQMIVDSKRDLARVVGDFPRLIIVLAHLGLPHLPVPGLWEAYQEMARFETIFMDTANIPSAKVVGLALRSFGHDRILFGTDEPLSLIRAKIYDHPVLGQRLATAHPYHWVDSVEQRQFGHLGQDAVLSHWQTLEAIRIAVNENTPLVKRGAAMEAIFRQNAEAIFRF